MHHINNISYYSNLWSKQCYNIFAVKRQTSLSLIKIIVNKA